MCKYTIEITIMRFKVGRIMEIELCNNSRCSTTENGVYLLAGDAVVSAGKTMYAIQKTY